jgi:hypothetical protein
MPTTTGKDMLASGQWAKVGPKRYRHASGIEVVYDCNRFAWGVGDARYPALWIARQVVEAMARSGLNTLPEAATS